MRLFSNYHEAKFVVDGNITHKNCHSLLPARQRPHQNNFIFVVKPKIKSEPHNHWTHMYTILFAMVYIHILHISKEHGTGHFVTDARHSLIHNNQVIAVRANSKKVLKGLIVVVS